MRNGVVWGVLAFGFVAAVGFTAAGVGGAGSWGESLLFGGVVFLALTVAPVLCVAWIVLKKLSVAYLADRWSSPSREVDEDAELEEPDPDRPAAWTEGQRAFFTFGILACGAAVAVGHASEHLLRGIGVGLGLFTICGVAPALLLGRVVAKQQPDGHRSPSSP